MVSVIWRFFSASCTASTRGELKEPAEAVAADAMAGEGSDEGAGEEGEDENERDGMSEGEVSGVVAPEAGEAPAAVAGAGAGAGATTLSDGNCTKSTAPFLRNLCHMFVLAVNCWLALFACLKLRSS